jgi:hypothetical protein
MCSVAGGLFCREHRLVQAQVYITGPAYVDLFRFVKVAMFRCVKYSAFRAYKRPLRSCENCVG